MSRSKRQHVLESSSEDSVCGDLQVMAFWIWLIYKGMSQLKVQSLCLEKCSQARHFLSYILFSWSCYSSAYCLSLRSFRRWTLTSLVALCQRRFDQHANHFLIQMATENADRDRINIGTMQPPWPRCLETSWSCSQDFVRGSDEYLPDSRCTGWSHKNLAGRVLSLYFQLHNT